MSLVHDMLPHALESLEDVLRTNEPQKRGDWRRKTLLELLTHASVHLTQTRLFLVNNVPPSVEMAGHTFDEHLEHALCRLAMAVQRRAEDRR